MNLDHLRYFEVLASLEHYGRAAEELDISQPTLTYAISQLEEELGVELFEKRGRRIYLTRYGEEFRKTVSSSLSVLESGTRLIKENGKNGSHITIGAIRTLGSTTVPKLLASFQSKVDHPVKFSLNSLDGLSSSILKGVEEKKFDFGFTAVPGDPAVFETIPFASSSFVVVTPLGHPLSKKDEVTLEETLPYPQILFSPAAGLRKAVDALFDSINAFPKITMETEEDGVIAGLAAAGFGIAVLPYDPLLESLPLKIIPLASPSSCRKAYLSRLKGRTLPSRAESFWEEAQKELLIDRT